MTKYKGKMCISRRTGGGGPDSIHLTLNEETSHVQFLEVEIDLATFANLITGSSYLNVDYETRGLDKLGWQAQNKTELVPFSRFDSEGHGGSPLLEAEEKALAPFEVDGWSARAGDIRNGHLSMRNKTDQRCQRVAFFRHVPPGHPDWDPEKE